jgi:hypothetical protein
MPIARKRPALSHHVREFLTSEFEDYVLADPARESLLLADLAEACHAMPKSVVHERNIM